MRTAERVSAGGIGLWLLLALAGAARAQRGPAPDSLRADNAELRQMRTVESALLHRRLDLGGLRRYSRARRSWGPAHVTGRLLVVNLWALRCAPCLRELPLFARMARAWRDKPDVEFLFVADPPEETSEEQVVEHWRTPGVPDQDPLRSSDARIQAVLTTAMKPLTLLVDSRRIIRQVFLGSLEERNVEMAAAMERLLLALREEPAAEAQRRRLRAPDR